MWKLDVGVGVGKTVGVGVFCGASCDLTNPLLLSVITIERVLSDVISPAFIFCHLC